MDRSRFGILVAAGALAVALAAVAWVMLVPGRPTPGGILKADEPAVVAQGRQVYAAECASCHGADLRGQPDWQRRKPDGLLPAPPHDVSGHTWHHPDAVLFALTKFGPAKMIGDPTYKSDMPAFEGRLGDGEIVAALSYIKSTWPADVRARHDRMNAEAARN